MILLPDLELHRLSNLVLGENKFSPALETSRESQANIVGQQNQQDVCEKIITPIGMESIRTRKNPQKYEYSLIHVIFVIPKIYTVNLRTFYN